MVVAQEDAELNTYCKQNKKYMYIGSIYSCKKTESEWIASGIEQEKETKQRNLGS